jgi:hypothetical protein
MKKYIRFSMRNKKNDITFPIDQAERILTSPQQLVMVYDEFGVWTGITINKAEIIMTDHDFGKENDESLKEMESHSLPEPALKPVDIEKFKPEFIKNLER